MLRADENPASRPASAHTPAYRRTHIDRCGVEPEYSWDVHRARMFDRCEPTTGIEPFGRLVEQVMTTEPYASTRRVFWRDCQVIGGSGSDTWD